MLAHSCLQIIANNKATTLTFIYVTTAHLFITIEGPRSEDVRLTSRRSGCVDVFLSEVWVPVANSRGTWQLESSQVVCRELGYSANGYSSLMH